MFLQTLHSFLLVFFTYWIVTGIYGGLKYGGRIDFVPFGLFTRMGQFRQADIVRENSPKLVFGGYYSYNDGISSRRGRVGGDIVFLNSDQEESLPDYQKYGVDFYLNIKDLMV